jgi:hypothetical protein
LFGDHQRLLSATIIFGARIFLNLGSSGAGQQRDNNCRY